MNRLILTATSLYLGQDLYVHEKNFFQICTMFESYTLLYMLCIQCECIAADDLYINRVPFDRYRFRLEWENINQKEGFNVNSNNKNITKSDTGSYKMEKCRNINPKHTHTPNNVPSSLLFLSFSHSFRCHSDLFYLLFLLAVLLLQVQNRLTKNNHINSQKKKRFSFKHNDIIAAIFDSKSVL